MGFAWRNLKSHSLLSDVVLGLLSVGIVACSGPATQPTVSLQTRGMTCDEPISSQDPYEAVLARARCDEPDMLVHSTSYVVRRVPSTPNVARFTVDHASKSLCCYEVDRQGTVTWRPEPQKHD
jgi:hypothetical protein